MPLQKNGKAAPLFCLALLLFLISVSTALAQTDIYVKPAADSSEAPPLGPPEFREPLRRNTLKFNALMAAFGVTEVAYQYSFNNRAVLLDVQYLSTSSDGVKYSVLGLTPEYRIYFGANSAAPKGLYAGPYVSYYNIDGSGDVTTKSNKTVHVEVTGDALAAGAVLGYQYVADAGFTFDIFVARGFRSGNISVSASDPTQTVSINSPLTGEDLRLGACLGFTF